MKKQWVAKRIAAGVTVAAVATVLLGIVVMLLWNGIVPALFNGPVLTFWQAVGLLLLSHILLRGWMPCHHRGSWRRERWRHQFEEKLAAMTPEEREKLKQEWPERCGRGPRDDNPQGAAEKASHEE